MSRTAPLCKQTFRSLAVLQREAGFTVLGLQPAPLGFGNFQLSWSGGERPVDSLLSRTCRAGAERAYAGNKPTEAVEWRSLAQTHASELNPCKSPLHPAVKHGVIEQPEVAEVLSVQEAYTPRSMCFGCGPSHPTGLHLRSMRIEGGLEATITVPSTFCAFPGILNGGIISTLIDCHSNWTAAIALMDRSCLPRPPLTLTASLLTTFKEPVPPDTPLTIRSKLIAISDGTQPGKDKTSVEVDVLVVAADALGQEQVLAHGTGIHKRLGALRAL